MISHVVFKVYTGNPANDGSQVVGDIKEVNGGDMSSLVESHPQI